MTKHALRVVVADDEAPARSHILDLLEDCAASLALQVWIHHSSRLGDLFGTQPITLVECSAWIALGAVPLLVLELGKSARRWVRAEPTLRPRE